MTHRMVVGIAAPMTLAFLTTPLLGIVDTAVVGQFGDAVLIGGLAIGALIFDVIFTTFNFLRSGTTGLVAQAIGREDRREEQAVFWRYAVTGFFSGLALLILSPILLWLGLAAIAPGPGVADAARTYFEIRIVSAPAALLNYAVLGYVLGRGQSFLGLGLQTLINGVNILLSIYLGLTLEWAIAGVAWATVAGETFGALVGVAFVVWRFDRQNRPALAQVLDATELLRSLAINRDIMIRSFALLSAFFLFTRTGAQFGAVTLASNAVLMNFFLVAGHYLDGFATAAEQIAGRAIGARHRPAFDRAVRLTLLWGYVLAAISTIFFLTLGGQIIDLMTTAGDVRAETRIYLPWAAITALCGVLAFQMDGVYIGSTWSADMRNAMLASLALFVACLWLLVPAFGNHGLWAALNIFLAVRGVTLYRRLPRRARESFP